MHPAGNASPTAAGAPVDAQPRARMHWMDLLRGVAIVLVLLWHAPAVPALFDYDMPGWLRAANDALLPFRMQTLMVLSGLLLPRSLAKPLGTYALGKIRLIVWPYVLFAALHMAQYGPDAPLWHPRAWLATGYLWFLFFVAVFYAIAPLLRRVPAWIPPLAMAAGALVVDDRMQVRLLYFGIFFFTGNLVARSPGLLDRATRSRSFLALCAVLAVGVSVLTVVRDTQYQALYAPGSLAGVVLAVAVAQRVPPGAVRHALEAVGRRSIVWYTAHFPVMTLVTVGALRAGVDSILVVAALDLAAAVAVCWLLARWRDRPPVRWLYDLPLPRTRGSAPRTP